MLQQQVLQVGELKLNPLVIIQLSLCLLNAVLSWAAAGSAWVVASAGGANAPAFFLDRVCSAGTCLSYASAAGGAVALGTVPVAIAGMALLCIAGIFAVCSIPLTLLKLRPQGLPAAGAARVTLSALGLAFGILGVVLPLAFFGPLPAVGFAYGPGLGLSIVAALLSIVHLVLFSREHCACCGAPPAGPTLPLAFAPTGPTAVATHNPLPAPAPAPAPAGLPPGWIRCGPEPASGDYWYENTLTGKSQWEVPT